MSTQKDSKSFLAVLVLAGTVGLSAVSAWGTDGVLSSVPLSQENYCHTKFPAIREETLSWDRPVLKDATASDIIDFYGPCDHDPLGKEEIQRQKQDSERSFGG